MGTGQNYAYVSQSDNFYRVRNYDGKLLKIPKNREVSEKYPVPISSNLALLQKLLIISVIGLVTSGVLNILIFPFLLINYKRLPEGERATGLNILYSFIAVFCASLILSVIFVVHIIY